MLLYLPHRGGGNRLTTGHIIILGFAVWLTLSNLFALDSSVSSRWYWEYIKICVMFFCSSFVVREFSQVRLLYFIALLSIGYIAYEMNIAYFLEDRLEIYSVGFGGLDNNGAGLMMAMGIPLAYFIWQAYKYWWRWIFLALIPIMLHAVLFSYLRGAMVALLLSAPLLIVRSVHKKGMMAFFIGITVLLPMLAGTEIRTRFFSTQEYDQDRSAQSRFESWHAAWRIAKDFPIFGVGIRNADLVSYNYGADVPGRAIHSQYLQIAADSGFPALVLYLLLLFDSWKALRRTQKNFRKSTSEMDIVGYNLACGLESAMAVFCIGAIFLSLETFELPYLLILLSLKLPLTMREEQSMVRFPAAVPVFANTVKPYTKA